MSKKICMISGKGGSGKTSLAFSFAKTLVKLNLSILLIDCDMSTHGATFFVKSKLEECGSSKILSVDDILNSPGMPAYGFTYTNPNIENNKSSLTNVLTLDDNLYFLPSDVSISKNQKSNELYYSTFSDFVNSEIDDLVDIVIFDCQAGYSDFTRQIISLSNICLLVSEPDAVSAAANKALCFQAGIELENVKTFQIFNKITDEEAKYYNKVAISAFFTNLTPILFNWKVRKAFALSQIPSIETIDLDFGKDILNILSAIFPEHNKRIKEFSNELFKDYRKLIEKKLYSLEQKQKTLNKINMFKRITYTLLIICIVCIFSFILLKDVFTIENNSIITSSSLIIALLSSTILSFNIFDRKDVVNNHLEECESEIQKLESMLIEKNFD